MAKRCRGTRSPWSRWTCWSTIVKFFMHSCRWRQQFHGRKAGASLDEGAAIISESETSIQVRMQVRHRMQVASCNRSVIDASCNILQLAVAKVPFSSASDSLREHLNTKYARTPVGLLHKLSSVYRRPLDWRDQTTLVIHCAMTSHAPACTAFCANLARGKILAKLFGFPLSRAGQVIAQSQTGIFKCLGGGRFVVPHRWRKWQQTTLWVGGSLKMVQFF